MTEFVPAAKLDDIKEGRLFPTQVDGELICFARVNGAICAFTDNCTHISGPLSDGNLVGHIVTCAWHGAQFNILTGEVLRGPARQPITTYPVTVEGDDIFICLPPEE